VLSARMDAGCRVERAQFALENLWDGRVRAHLDEPLWVAWHAGEKIDLEPFVRLDVADFGRL